MSLATVSLLTWILLVVTWGAGCVWLMERYGKH